MDAVRRQPMLLPSEALPALVEQAVRFLRAHEPPEGYYGAFSGGKDSTVIKELARLAGVRVVWHYNVTTIDPPELVRFIREQHPDVAWDRSTHGNLLHRLVSQVPPTRTMRWCCREFKEQKPPAGALVIVGVRAAESPRRASSWKPITLRHRPTTWCAAPILSWSDADVWEFIHTNGLPYCSLYDPPDNFKRLGCVGCPMSNRRAAFARWPRFEVLWRLAIARWWERTKDSDRRSSLSGFTSADEAWEWWMRDRAEDPDADESDACQLHLEAFAGGMA